jgi:hypothetical protein
VKTKLAGKNEKEITYYLIFFHEQLTFLASGSNPLPSIILE